MIVSFLPHWVAHDLQLLRRCFAVLLLDLLSDLPLIRAHRRADPSEVLGRHNLSMAIGLSRLRQDHSRGDEFGEERIISGATGLAQQNLPRPLTKGLPVQTCGR